MIKKLTVLAAAWLGLGGMQAPAAPPATIELWRLHCGEFVIKQYGAFFSDTFQYPPGPKDIVGSCYLIRHGSRYMLWDTGLPDALIGKDFDNAAQTIRLRRSLVDQLAEIGVRPEQIETIGISHWHFDHVGQAGRFPQARLLMGKGDLDLLRATPPVDADSARGLAHWLGGPGKASSCSSFRATRPAITLCSSAWPRGTSSSPATNIISPSR
jgi:N-acyl homoserine lactone hydrolase